MSDRQEVHQEVKSTSHIFILGFKQVVVMVASRLSSYRHGYQVKIILKMLHPPTGCNKNISETSETRTSVPSVSLCYDILSLTIKSIKYRYWSFYCCDILQWYITIICYCDIYIYYCDILQWYITIICYCDIYITVIYYSGISL